MPSSRRTRRRYERARAKRPVRDRRLAPVQRITFVVAGVVLVLAGVILLVSGKPGTAMRLARLAGLMIIIGLVLAGIGVYGRH